MALFSLSQLRERGTSRIKMESMLGPARTASAKLATESAAFSAAKIYDIFLSHSALDAEIIYGLKIELEGLGFSVYVYWIEDPQARETVNGETAVKLKVRMQSCTGLLYAASGNASASRWMPWELGYFDGIKQRVAVVPIEKDNRTCYFRGFKGQEYLDLYPYVSLSEGATNLPWIWARDGNPVSTLRAWLR
jgi:hypothetical protein